MQIRPISELSKELDFQPLTPWPSTLPPIAWCGHLVTGFERHTGVAVDYTEASIECLIQLLKDCYPQLGLAQAARLKKNLRTAQLPPELVFQILNWRESEFLNQLMAIVLTWSQKTQEWCDQRKMAPGDFAILQSFTDRSALNLTIETLSRRQSGKNHAVRILELTGELILMDQGIGTPPATDMEWLQQLELQRFPRAQGQDREKAKAVEAVPWPRHVQAGWRRRGDKGVLEVQLQVDSPESWKKRLEELSRLTEKIPWKN